MRHIQPYNDNGQSFGINNPHSYRDLMINESAILARAEEAMPENIMFELELNMLLNEGFGAVDKFHRELVKGTNLLTDKVKGLTSDQMKEINEAFDNIKADIESLRFNEQAVQTNPLDAEADVGGDNWSNIMNNVKGAVSGSEEKSKGIIGILKDMLASLTEGGSPIGIIHFILDIVGIVGDFFGPVGVIADMLNGIIYMIRAINGDTSKWLLALISFIAAVIPFGGDIMKGIFKGSKAGKGMLEISTAYVDWTKATGKTSVRGIKQTKISPEAVNLIAKASPETIEGLKYVSGATSKAMPLASKLISGFFKSFLGRVAGWIPFIGKPLKSFFDSIANMFTSFKGQAVKFADDIPEAIKLADLKKIDGFFSAAAVRGSRIVSDGKNLKVVSATGAPVAGKGGIKDGILNVKLLGNAGAVQTRYGSVMGKQIDDAFIKASDRNIGDFFQGIALANKSMGKFFNTAVKVGTRSFIFKAKLPLFIGKQIIKFVGSHDPLSDGEIEAIGMKSIQQVIQDERDEYLDKNPGAAYHVPILDMNENPEVAKILNNTLNIQAERFGMPRIIDVVYARDKHKDKLPKEVKDFYDAVYDEEKIKKIESMENRTIGESVDNKSLIHIKPVSDFLK